MYSIKRYGSRWLVMFGWQILESFGTKSEALEWVANHG